MLTVKGLRARRNLQRNITNEYTAMGIYKGEEDNVLAFTTFQAGNLSKMKQALEDALKRGDGRLTVEYFVLLDRMRHQGGVHGLLKTWMRPPTSLPPLPSPSPLPSACDH